MFTPSSVGLPVRIKFPEPLIAPEKVARPLGSLIVKFVALLVPKGSGLVSCRGDVPPKLMEREFVPHSSKLPTALLPVRAVAAPSVPPSSYKSTVPNEVGPVAKNAPLAMLSVPELVMSSITSVPPAAGARLARGPE